MGKTRRQKLTRWRQFFVNHPWIRALGRLLRRFWPSPAEPYRPQTVVPQTPAWSQGCPVAGMQYQELYPPLPLQRTPPATLDDRLHWQFELDYGDRSPVGFLLSLPQGRFWGNCAVISPEGALLGDLSVNFKIDPCQTPQKHPVFWKALPPPQVCGDRVAVLSSPGGNTYFHWMVDVLPRIHLLRLGLERWGLDWGAIAGFLVNGTAQPFQSESLAALGIPLDRCWDSTAQPHWQADRLLVPSRPRWGTCAVAPWAFDFLRHTLPAALGVVPLGRRRLYISRGSARRRRVLQEPQLIQRLQGYGFEAVQLEHLSLGEQIALFQSAEAIVAPHGAGLTNLVFCAPGTWVLEMFSPNYVSVSYWNISSQLGLNYWYLFTAGDRPAPFTDPHHLEEDLQVNLGDVEQVLSRWPLD